MRKVVFMSVAVILAGGKSRRMGRDKLALSLDGRTLLESAVGRFAEVFDRVFLSVADAGKYPDIAVERIVDILPGAGPMSGLHAALTALPDDGVFLVAADLPFACPHAAMKVIGLCGDNNACVIRLPGGRLEPLFGFYRRALLPMCEAALRAGDFKMTALLPDIGTRFVSPGELGASWDERLIMNINFPEDYEGLLGSHG